MPSKQYIYLVLQLEPLLEVLVGSTLEQGLMEVLQEEELAAMRSQQQRFEQVGWTAVFCSPVVHKPCSGWGKQSGQQFICVPGGRGSSKCAACCNRRLGHC